MNTYELVPRPSHWNAFRRSKERFVPETSGCYVLSTFSGVVLYIGQATNLCRRMINHLDNPDKTESTVLGRAVLFHWLECSDIARIERTWMNIHIQKEGALPLLNRAYAPVST